MNPLLEARDFSFYYQGRRALDSISMPFPRNRVTVLIGPSGSGKTTLLRSFNRVHELVPGCVHSGDIFLAGRSIFDPRLKVLNLRRCVGMVFQKVNPFPRTIYENVIYGARLAGERRKPVLDQIVENCLVRAALWDEVRHQLHEGTHVLSGGQTQRLCIARALACDPPVLLMDEPCSALDLVTTLRIERLVHELKKEHTVVLSTNNLAQAARCADYVGFLHFGKLVEFGPVEQIFMNPSHPVTRDYTMGRLGPVNGRATERMSPKL